MYIEEFSRTMSKAELTAKVCILYDVLPDLRNEADARRTDIIRLDRELRELWDFVKASNLEATVVLGDAEYRFTYSQLDSFLDYKTLAEAEEKRNADTD